MVGELDGKACVVTGATRGIGAAIARRFAADGARLLLSGTDEATGSALVAEIRANGGEAQFVAGDIREEETSDRVAAAARSAFGRIDALVLNAGVFEGGRFWELTPQQFDRTMDVNVRGVWLCARACYGLIPPGGSIVTLASVSSVRSYSGESIYCVSKAAVLHLTRVMAQDLAPRGVRVNALVPGVIGGAGMTQDLADRSDDPKALLAAYIAAIPLRRAGTPGEMAEGALFLATGRSAYMTGQTLILDGGVLL
jgi:NAD(P)-dependent dehydrogenase (short-subunit alcohol dehydrogenase family)